jgi:hypothetical protein
MIHKCIDLFNLLPTSQPHYWLIAADWLEEENLDVTAIAFREGIFVINDYKNFKLGNKSKCIAQSNGSYEREQMIYGWGWGSSASQPYSFDNGEANAYGRGDGSGMGRGYGDGIGR